MSKNKEYGTELNWNYVIISLVVLVILTLLVLYMPNLREIDMNILHSIRLALSPYPISYAQVISEFGRANHMLWPQIAAGSVLISEKRYMKCFLLIFFTQASFVVTDFFKDFVCRERPGIMCYSGFSFPSGHSSTTMCFYGILIYLVLHYAKSDFWRYFLTSLFGIFIFLVCLSRLWLGVHFLTDVVAGLLLGFLLVNLYIIVSKAMSK